MSVTVAKTAGFCFGVRRAVDLAEQQAKQGGEIYAYGEIIHNMHEIARLEKMGVHTAQTISGIPDGERVLIRAHRSMTHSGRKTARSMTQPVRSCRKYTGSSTARAGTDALSSSSARRATPRWRAYAAGAARAWS